MHKISMKSIPQKEKDGYEQIFSLFEIAKNKYAHSKLWFKLLRNGYPNIADSNI